MMGKLFSYNPATLEAVGSVNETPIEELPDIIGRSRAAQKKWENVPPKKKAEYFKRLTEITADRSEDIGEIVFNETGKPKAEAINMEAYVSASSAKYCELWLKRFKFEKKIKLTPVSGMMKIIGRSSRIVYKPFGVVLSISSNNFPICLAFTEAATAIAAGNSVIIKPSPDTPLCGEFIVSLFKEAGFPEDLLICVNGPMVGETLTSSPDIDRILFTGSTRTGKSIMNSASKNLIPLSLELGGCDPVIVLKDADLDRAVTCGVWGAFTNAGQVCVGFQRILVHRSLYDRYVEKFVEETKALKIGADWNDPDISIGPVINECALENVKNMVAKAVESGGRIVCGGKRMERKGYFFEPTVIIDVPTDSAIFNTEVFGPYVTITPFDTEDEAITIANSSDYALGGSVWSRDCKHAREVAKRLDSGIVDVNNGLYNYGMPTTPWGGCKSSGFGKTHGEEGFINLMRVQHIHTDKGGFEVDPWWMPFRKENTDFQVELTKGLYGTKKHVLKTLIHALPLLKKRK